MSLLAHLVPAAARLNPPPPRHSPICCARRKPPGTSCSAVPAGIPTFCPSHIAAEEQREDSRPDQTEIRSTKFRETRRRRRS